MQDLLLYIYVRDEDYGRRLHRLINSRRLTGVKVELVTKPEKIHKSVSKSTRVTVLTDIKDYQQSEGVECIFLSDVDDGSGIFQYQKGENLYRDLLVKLGVDRTNEVRTDDSMGEIAGVYAVFSPNPSDATMAASVLSQLLGSYGKCIYLCMSGFWCFCGDAANDEKSIFSTVKSEYRMSEKEGLSYAMFSLERNNFKELINKLKVPLGNSDMLYPVNHFTDLLDCKARDWQTLFERLRKECGYECIVVDMGQLFEFSFEVLAGVDYPIYIKEKGFCGDLYEKIFRYYMELEDGKEAIQRCIFTYLPLEKEEWLNNLKHISISEFFEQPFVKNALVEWYKHLEKEEDDVCCYEEE